MADQSGLWKTEAFFGAHRERLDVQQVSSYSKRSKAQDVTSRRLTLLNSYSCFSFYRSQ